MEERHFQEAPICILSGPLTAQARSPVLRTGEPPGGEGEKVAVRVVGAPLLALVSVLDDRAVVVHALHVQVRVKFFVASWK